MTRKKKEFQFNPSVSLWDTDHLVFIVHDESLFWEEDAIRQARDELSRRNISIEYEQCVLGDKNREELYLNKLLELGEDEEKFNALKEYTMKEKIAILIASPLILLGKVSVGDSLTMLKQSNYRLKYRMRSKLLLWGVIMWVFLLSLAYVIGSPVGKKEVKHQPRIMRVIPQNPYLLRPTSRD